MLVSPAPGHAFTHVSREPNVIFQKIERAARETELPRLPKGLKSIFTGMPRGGTGYVWRVLLNLGHNWARHEGLFGYSRPHTNPHQRQDTEYEVTGFAAPWLDQVMEQRSDIRIVTLMRHPVKCINSMVNAFGRNKRGVVTHGWGEMCDVYYRWMRWSAKLSSELLCLEHMQEHREGVRYFLWLPTALDPSEWNRVINTTDRGPSMALPIHGTWADLPTWLRKFAEEFGYTRQTDD